MNSGGASGRASRQARAWRQACSRTHRPSGRISPVSSASGTNESGGISPRTGMLPAHERLEPDDPVGREVDQRLVVQAQLAAFDAPSQVALEVDPLDRLVRHRRLEQGMALGRIRLGLDHRDLGFAEHLLGRRPPAAPERDPDRRADEPFAVTHRERGAQLGVDPLGDPVGLVDAGDLLEQDPELVATKARHRVARVAGRRSGAGRPPRGVDRRRCGRRSR